MVTSVNLTGYPPLVISTLGICVDVQCVIFVHTIYTSGMIMLFVFIKIQRIILIYEKQCLCTGTKMFITVIFGP